MSRSLLRTGALLLLVLALVSCSETPPVSPTPKPAPTPSSPAAETPTIERSLSDYLTGVGVGAEIGTLGYDPEFAEIFDAMQLRNEWVEVSDNIYHWGTSVDGQTGAGARVSRVSVAEFDAAVVGSARSCATLIEENVEVAGIYEISPFTLFGRPGRSFIEGYGDGAIRGACADLPDSILLVEVTDPLFVTVNGSSRLAAQEILAAIAAGRDPFSGATVKLTASGTATVGRTLTAGGTWAGYPSPTLRYHWYVCTEAVTAARSTVPSTCKRISGATRSTFKLTSAQRGKYVAVLVTGTSLRTTATTWLSKTTAKIR